MVRITVGLLLAAGLCSAAPVPKSLKRQVSIDGRWKAVVMNHAGSDILSSHPTVWDIADGTVSRFFAGPNDTLQPENLTITIAAPDPARPDEIDYVQVVGRQKTLFRARVRVTADELSIRFAEMDAPRPADMAEGTDGWLYRFKRVEK
jgi:hypothetical protein